MASVRPFSGSLGTIGVDHFREMFGFWVEWNMLLHPNFMNPYLVWRSLPQFLYGPAFLTWKQFSEKHSAEITEWRQYWAPRYIPDVSGVAVYSFLQEPAASFGEEAVMAGNNKAESSCREMRAMDTCSENGVPDGPVPPFNPVEELFAVLRREYGEVRSDKLSSLKNFCHLPGESLRDAYMRLTDLSRGVLSERQAIQYWLSSLDEDLQERVKGMITTSSEGRTLTRVFQLSETALADKLQRAIMLSTLTVGNGAQYARGEVPGSL